MNDSQREALLKDCTFTLAPNGTPSQERAREMYRLGVRLAREAYKECQETGLDPDEEYSTAVDEAEKLELNLQASPPDGVGSS